MHTRKKSYKVGCIYIFIFVHTHKYVRIIKKEAIYLRVGKGKALREGRWEGVKGGKAGGSYIIILSKTY